MLLIFFATYKSLSQVLQSQVILTSYPWVFSDGLLLLLFQEEYEDPTAIVAAFHERPRTSKIFHYRQGTIHILRQHL